MAATGEWIAGLPGRKRGETPQRKRREGDDRAEEKINGEVSELFLLCFGSKRILKCILKYCSMGTVRNARFVSSDFNKWFRSYLFSRYYIIYSRAMGTFTTNWRVLAGDTDIVRVKCGSSFNKASLPNSVTHIKFEDYYNQSFTKETVFPPLLTRLILGSNFNHPVENFPQTLIRLEFGNIFDQPIDNLPPSLTHLRFNDLYQQPLDKLPPKLTHLYLGKNFNLPIDNLPQTITHLSIGAKFDQPIDHLPYSLKHLIFHADSRFNQKVDRLPPFITFLFLGNSFNHPLDNLPPSLQYLRTGDAFNCSVDKLPKSILSIKFGQAFNRPVDNLPPNLLRVSFTGSFAQSIDCLPSSIQMLSIHIRESVAFPPIKQLPQSLTTLTLVGKDFGTIKFPDSLTDLTVAYPVGSKLAKSITHITFDELPTFVHPELANVARHLPATITHLTFGRRFNTAIGNLPLSVTHLKFGNCFDKPIGFLSRNFITHLTFGDYFNKPVDCLPDTLTHLRLPSSYYQPLSFLPKSLTHLAVGICTEIDKLPASLLLLYHYYRKSTTVVSRKGLLVSFDPFWLEVFF